MLSQIKFVEQAKFLGLDVIQANRFAFRATWKTVGDETPRFFDSGVDEKGR